MPPEIGANETYVHPAIMVVMAVVMVLMFRLPRKHVILPFLAAALLVPMDQVAVIGPFHFQMLRLLILFGWIRVLVLQLSAPHPFFPAGMNLMDKAIAVFAVVTAVDIVLLWQDSSALINQLGNLYTVLGTYFLLRFFLRSEKDVESALRTTAYIAAAIAVIMVVERTTGRNPYALLGGSRAWTRETLMARDVGYRALGPFQHPILAGTFGGISLPLFVALWWKKQRVAAAVGVIAASAIVIASGSSTPALAYVAGLAAIALWPLRNQMRMLRWGIVIVLLGLHLVMKAPVWALISRVDVVGGSSSYHRFELIDQCLNHFGDWWLVGTKNFADWGWDMWDLANQYVEVADTSGLLPLLSFLAIIVFAFRSIGRARKRAAGSRSQELFLWTLGAAVFANVVAFWGISYYDQTIVVWYALLAMLPAAALTAAHKPAVVMPAPAKSHAPSTMEMQRFGQLVAAGASEKEN